jgi:hypothetical protein
MAKFVRSGMIVLITNERFLESLSSQILTQMSSSSQAGHKTALRAT